MDALSTRLESRVPAAGRIEIDGRSWHWDAQGRLHGPDGLLASLDDVFVELRHITHLVGAGDVVVVLSGHEHNVASSNVHFKK